MSGSRDSGYNGGKGRESGRYGRSGYGTDPSLYSYNSPLRQTADSPPSRHRSYRAAGDREERQRSRFDDTPRRYEEPSRRFGDRFHRDYEDKPRSRDYDSLPRSRDYDDRPRSRDYENDRPRSAINFRNDNSGSAPGTLSSSLRSRKARDDPEKSFCAMAGDYLGPSDYDGRRVHPRFQDDYASRRKKRNTAADDLVKAVLARDAMEHDYVGRRPRYSTEAHGMDSPTEELTLNENFPLKSGLVLGRPIVREERPYDSLPAMHHDWDSRRSAMSRSASCDEPMSPEGSITPTPSMYRSFSPQSSVPCSPGPYTYCETPKSGVPPPPAYERRFLDGVPCSPSSTVPSTPTGSAPTTPTGTLTNTPTSRPSGHPLAGSSSTPLSPTSEPGAPRYNTAKYPDKPQEYDDRTSRSDSGGSRKPKKGSRKGLMGVFDSDWSDTGSLLRDVLDRRLPGRLGKSLFDDEEDCEGSWDEEAHPDGKSHTREKTYDLGDGRKCHVKETSSISSPDKDRNLFDKYRFKFGSFGSFDDDDGDDRKEVGKDTVEFVDFDDLIRKLKQKPNVESPFNSLRKSPVRRSPVPEEKQRRKYPSWEKPPSPESGIASKESIPEEEAKDSERATPNPEEKSEAANESHKTPKEDKNKSKPNKEEKKPTLELDPKKVITPISRFGDSSPPIDLVSQEYSVKDVARSPLLGRARVPIPLPYEKISKENDHECDESHYNHVQDCPEG